MSIHGNLSNHMISGRVKVKSNVEDFLEIAAVKMVALGRILIGRFLPQATPRFLSLMII